MSTLSTSDDLFRTTVKKWLDEHGELLMLIRYSRAGGAKDFVLVSDIVTFGKSLENLPAGTSVIMFHEAQLPYRGVVDQEFIGNTRRSLGDAAEYLALCFDAQPNGTLDWFACETMAELTTNLNDWTGRRAAVGLHPSWLEDGEDVIAAVVPDASGTSQAGIY